uniref:Uncharacterized protein n=1 Tax=uncultured marine group II/III euryarchaeote SAT1000_34_C08 TaxID=1456576 RepID=A0A075ICP2_9EURY|nr:hypothetical protein [uncultured marine group II/III euryarchaeote SAT1000_34_C08]
MEQGLDGDWLLGESRWWKLSQGEKPPDLRAGEASPPDTWGSSSPRKGGRGWIRQRHKPVSSSILLPLAWSPFFLAMTAAPLVFPDKVPYDREVAASLFAISWLLILIPLYMARNDQSMSDDGLFSLPFDWRTFVLAALLFPLHILWDPLLGWISYALFWLAWLRSIGLIQDILSTPPARWLLPIETSGWSSSNLLGPRWEVISENWTTGPMAIARCEHGHLSIGGVSRDGIRFLGLTLVHRSGFVQDPFFESKASHSEVQRILSRPPVEQEGLEWPKRLIVPDEEE